MVIKYSNKLLTCTIEACNNGGVTRPDHGPFDLMNPTCPKKPDPTNVWTGLGPKFLTRYKSRAWVKFFDLKPKKSNLAQPDLKIIHKNQVLPDLAKTRPNPIMYQDESG